MLLLCLLQVLMGGCGFLGGRRKDRRTWRRGREWTGESEQTTGKHWGRGWARTLPSAAPPPRVARARLPQRGYPWDASQQSLEPNSPTDQGNEGAGGGRKCNKGGQEKQQTNLALQRDLPLRIEELLLLFSGRLLLRSTESLAIRPTPSLSWGSGLPGQEYPGACPLPLLPHLDIQLSQSGLDSLASGFKFHL